MAGTHFTSHRIQFWIVCPTRVSRLPDSPANAVANHLAEALSGRELQRVRRVSHFVSLPTHAPTHRSRGMSVVRWPSRTPQAVVTQHQRSRNPRGFLRWMGHSLTHSPRPCRTPTSSPIIIGRATLSIRHPNGQDFSPSPHTAYVVGLAPPSLSHTLLLHRPPANCCPHSAKSQHPRQAGKFLQDLSYSTRTSAT